MSAPIHLDLLGFEGMLFARMACVYRLHVFASKIGYPFGLFRQSSVSNHFISVRELCFTACHGKTPAGKSKSHIENDLENDLDFFGINESNEKDSKKFRKMSTSEKNSIDDIVEKYAVPTGPKNIQLKQYGSVRYDKELPNSEMQQPKHLDPGTGLGTKIKQTRKQKRLNRGAEMNKTYSNPSFILHSENDVGSSEMTEHKEQVKSSGRNSSSPQKNENMKDDFSFSKSKDMTPISKSVSFIDKQYFSYDGGVERDDKSEHSLENRDKGEKDSHSKILSEKDLSFIDEQYFSYNGNVENEAVKTQTSDGLETFLPEKKAGRKAVIKTKDLDEDRGKTRTEKEVIHKNDQQDLSFVDEQYFSYNVSTKETQLKYDRLQNPDDLHRKREKHQQVVTPSNSVRYEKDLKETSSSNETDDTLTQRADKRKDKPEINQLDKNVDETPETEKKQTVYDASMKVRTELEKKRGANLIGKFDPKKYDSKGFRILADQVPHFENAPSIDVLQVLRKSIIYDKNDIVAITKPYGLPSHDGPGVFHSVGNLLDQLIPRTQLFPVHRLDKETTGVMLFAKTEEMANRISECFLRREVSKKYLVITKNIPEMQSGEIDIPIAEGTVEGKVRMCLRPYSSPELSAIAKKRQPGTHAVTKYKVLDQGKKCALLECFPVTGKKHQIRVHLALGLNCPILGDHKYSHINKIAPMKLHPEILDRLKIQQSKVRYLAMHLHARSIMIPEFLNGRNLFVSAPLPPHFVRNMKDLKLKLPPRS